MSSYNRNVDEAMAIASSKMARGLEKHLRLVHPHISKHDAAMLWRVIAQLGDYRERVKPRADVVPDYTLEDDEQDREACYSRSDRRLHHCRGGQGITGDERA